MLRLCHASDRPTSPHRQQSFVLVNTPVRELLDSHTANGHAKTMACFYRERRWREATEMSGLVLGMTETKRVMGV